MSEEDLNLVQIFWDRAARYGSRTALLYKDRAGGPYLPISWNEWGERVKKTALGLEALGVRKGDRVGILSENRPEWTFADLGILSLGAAGVPIYPTSSAQEIAYILENAGIEILFVSTAGQFEKIKETAGPNPKIRKLILFDRPAAPAGGPVSPAGGPASPEEKVLSLAELEEAGRRENLNNAGLYRQRVEAVRPGDLATIIYTSGTTGPPKGVMLTHRNFIFNYLGAREVIPVYEDDIALSFLPLSHVFERLAGYYYMLACGATIAYAENMQTVAEDMTIVRPTVAAAVPRFYEKVAARIHETVAAGPPLRKKIFEWAVGVGREISGKKMGRQSIPFGLRLRYALAKALVFNKLKHRLGGRIRFFISGGAPLAKDLAEFFYAAGVLILEGYGLTETSPVMTVNAVERFRFGSVGLVIPGVEVKIAEDGEILTRGPCVMQGYFKNPGATGEAIRDGWFLTGDIGEFDKDGFLKITDRKKDIIVTSGGKKASPQNIENLILGDCAFSQVVVLGDKRNYLVALVVPNFSELARFARERGLENLTRPALLSHPAVYERLDSRLRERTRELAPYEQIKYFALLERELTQEAGELTPTLKVRRRIVTEKYRAEIEALYGKGAAVRPAPLRS